MPSSTTSDMVEVGESEIVVVDYEDIVITPSLRQDDNENFNTNKHQKMSPSLLEEKLEKAFGLVDGIGIIAIRNVPNFVKLKESVLRLAHPLAHLPPEALEDLEDVKSMYNVGWSHGKEMLKKKPDFAKASFYFNPLTDTPGTPEERRRYPVSYPCNRWPTQSLPKLEPSAKALGSLMKDVTVHLSHHIDAYVQGKNPNYKPRTLYNHLVNTDKVKGRLLYYYPLNNNINKNSNTTHEEEEDSWTGWHNDSGFLTVLAGDLFVDDVTGEKTSEVSLSAGLYVVNRQNQVCKVQIPRDCMAIQIGECTQIITGGAVLATPHCVRGDNNSTNVARASLACFVDTPPSVPLSIPSEEENDAIMQKSILSHSSKVPPLSARWENGVTFGDFLQKTFQMYYEMK